MPTSVLEARQTWIDRHPDWDLRVWRLEDLTWLRNQSLFDRAVPYSQKADFARYEVVHRFGGVYLDTDMECLRPIDTLLEGIEFFAGREPSGNVAAGIFGTTPSHPIIREVIERLPASCLIHPIDQLSYTTGPMILNRVLRDGEWEDRPGTRIFPAAYFYPYAGWEPWRRQETFSRAYAVHHWGHSWKGQRGVTAHLADLLPRQGEPILPSIRALWREAADRGATEWASVRKRAGQHLHDLAYPAYRFTKGIVHRVVPVPETLPSIAWERGEVLVATPFRTRLLLPTDDLSLSPELALTGTHDRSFVDLMRRLRPDMTFVDVGANVGFFTILGAARVGPRGKVIAYEHDPELLELIRRNVVMNRFGDRVRLIPKAAQRDGEERRLRVPRDRRKGLANLTRSQDGVEDVQELRVACERLDVALGDVSYVDLVKIDFEESEAVLDGASGLLDAGKVGAIAMRFRQDALSEELQERMGKQLTSLVRDRGASLHGWGNPRSISLDEVRAALDHRQLLIRLPGASIEP